MASPAPSIADIQDELLEEIFSRLPTPADLARASTASASFCRVIADHTFLRRYRVLHPPPLIGMLQLHEPFVPAQPPHPSTAAARPFAGFDFSCSSFLPSAAGRSWSPINFLHGRALHASAPVNEERGRRILAGSEVCDSHYSQFLTRDLAVCDPVHRVFTRESHVWILFGQCGDIAGSGGAWPRNLGGPAVGNYSRVCVSLAKNTYILQENRMGWAGHGQFGLAVAPPLIAGRVIRCTEQIHLTWPTI